MRAYIDESVRVAAPGLYVLAAAVVRHEQANEARAQLLDGLRHRRGRFHWHSEDPADRESMAKVVGGLDLVSVVAVATPVDPHRQERARRRCLTQLLWELEQRQVLDVLLESRVSLDRKDRAHILTGQKAGHLTRALVYDFAKPSTEPLLWLPDLVAGAVAYARLGIDGRYLQALAGGVTVVEAGPGD